VGGDPRKGGRRSAGFGGRLDFLKSTRTEGDNLQTAEFRIAGAGRNEVPHDHVFFESGQVVDFAEGGGICENTCRFLEGGGGNETFRLDRGLCDSEENRLPFRRLAARFGDPLVLAQKILPVDQKNSPSPGSVIRTLRSIWEMINSMCLSLIVTPCIR